MDYKKSIQELLSDPAYRQDMLVEMQRAKLLNDFRQQQAENAKKKGEN